MVLVAKPERCVLFYSFVTRGLPSHSMEEESEQSEPCVHPRFFAKAIVVSLSTWNVSRVDKHRQNDDVLSLF